MVLPEPVGGRRYGERHHRARIPDAVVHELRDLYEHRALTCRQLVELFAGRDPPVRLTYRVVRKLVNYERRCDDPPPTP